MTDQLAFPWADGGSSTDLQWDAARKLDSLKRIVATNFPRRHSFVHGSQARERCWTIIRAAIRGCRVLTGKRPDSEAIFSAETPTDYRAMIATQIDAAGMPTPFLTRQAMSADFAVSVLRAAVPGAPAGVVAAVTAAAKAVSEAASALHAVAPELPAALRGDGCSRVEFITDAADGDARLRLAFYHDDRMVGQIMLPATATVADTNRIVDGFMRAYA